MKTFFKKALIGIIMATSMFVTSACTWFGQEEETPTPVTITSFVFQPGSVVYEREDDFTLVGTTLKFTMSDGSIRTIVLSDSMIKVAPDMSTTGVKTAVITYNGVDYSITFNVVSNETDMYITNIYNFLQTYNQGGIDISQVSSTVALDLDFAFLQNQEQILENGEFALTQEDMQMLLEYSNLQDVEPLYNMLLNSLVNASYDLGAMQNLNLTNYTMELNGKELVESFAQNLATQDYQSYYLQVLLQQHQQDFLDLSKDLAWELFNGLYSEYDNQIVYDLLGTAIYSNVYTPLVNSQPISSVALFDDLIFVLQNATVENTEARDQYISAITIMKESDAQYLITDLLEELMGNISVKGTEEDLWGSYEVSYSDAELSQSVLDAKYNYIDSFITIFGLMEEISNYTPTQFFTSILDNLTIIMDSCTTLESNGNYLISSEEYRVYNGAYIAATIMQQVALVQDGGMPTEEFYDLLSHFMGMVLAEAFYDSSLYTISQTEYFETIYDGLIVNLPALYVGDLTIEEFVNETLSDMDVRITIWGDLLNNLSATGSLMVLSQMFSEYNVYADYNQDELLDLGLLMSNITQIDTLVTLQGNTLVVNFETLDDLEYLINSSLTLFVNLYEPRELDSQTSYIMQNIMAVTDANYNYFERLQNLVELNGDMVFYALSSFVFEYLDIYGNEVAMSEVEDWLTASLDSFVGETPDYETMLSGFLALVNDYGCEESKAVTYSTMALVMFILDDGTVDYNAVFADIDLPEQIESIDFNQLVSTIKSESTYQDIFTMSNVEVQTVLDGTGNVTQEILNITFSVDFDILISSITGDFTISLVINY